MQGSLGLVWACFSLEVCRRHCLFVGAESDVFQVVHVPVTGSTYAAQDFEFASFGLSTDGKKPLHSYCFYFSMNIFFFELQSIIIVATWRSICRYSLWALPGSFRSRPPSYLPQGSVWSEVCWSLIMKVIFRWKKAKCKKIEISFMWSVFHRMTWQCDCDTAWHANAVLQHLCGSQNCWCWHCYCIGTNHE